MYADELIVMNKGTIAMKGSPREVFGQHTQLKEYGLMFQNRFALC